MKTKSLIQTNPYLKDPSQRQKLNERSVRSSCGVEGIKIDNQTKPITIVRREKTLYIKFKSKLTSS